MLKTEHSDARPLLYGHPSSISLMRLRDTWTRAQANGVVTKAGVAFLLLLGAALGLINMLSLVHLIVAIFSS